MTEASMTPTVTPPRVPRADATAALQAHQATLPQPPLTLDPEELAHLTVDTAAATVFPGPGGRPVQYRAAITPAGHAVTVELTGQVWLTDHAHDTWIPLGYTPTARA